MTATACTLAVLLAFEAASAPAAKKEECELTDDRCKAALYERRSMTAANANHRAQYLFNAHNLYLRLFDKTGNTRDLCAARRAIEASLAVDDQPETLRSESQALRTKLLARAKQQGARCGSKTKRHVVPADAPLVARAPTAGPAEGPTTASSVQSPPASPTARPATEPTTTPAGSAPSTTPTPRGKLPLLADADTATTERPAAVALMPVASRQVESPPASSRPPGRGLMIAGGVTLGVGAALTAAAGVMGYRAGQTRREAFALHEKFDPYAPPDVATQGDGLISDFNAMKSQTIALAVSGGVTVVLGAVLATVGGRRMNRTARRTALVPGPGGLVLHGRF